MEVRDLAIVVSWIPEAVVLLLRGEERVRLLLRHGNPITIIVRGEVNPIRALARMAVAPVIAVIPDHPGKAALAAETILVEARIHSLPEVLEDLIQDEAALAVEATQAAETVVVLLQVQDLAAEEINQQHF